MKSLMIFAGQTIQLIGFVVTVAGVAEEQTTTAVIGLLIVVFGLTFAQANIQDRAIQNFRDVDNRLKSISSRLNELEEKQN